jgi:hypothetical protein
MSDSDAMDEWIGSSVEETLPEKKTVAAKKKPKTPKIPASRRQEAISLKVLGKEDPEFHVIEGNRKGSCIVRKRPKPLQPVQEQALIPSAEIPKVEKVEPVKAPPAQTQTSETIPVITYFNNQNSVNNSLSRELEQLSEMYNRLEAKYGEVKKTLKKGKGKAKPQRQTVNDDDDDEPTEEEINAYAQYLYEQQLAQQQQQQPPQMHRSRRYIDINKLQVSDIFIFVLNGKRN